MRRALVLILASMLLWALVGQLNHGLALRHVSLFAGGLLISTAALTSPLKSGIAATAAIGLVCDANAPVPFGTLTFLFVAAHVLIFRLRDRLPIDETAGRVAVSLLANLALFLSLSLLQIGRIPFLVHAWPRLVADLILSQLFILLAGPWFFALQVRALDLVNADRERWI